MRSDLPLEVQQCPLSEEFGEELGKAFRANADMEVAEVNLERDVRWWRRRRGTRRTERA